MSVEIKVPPAGESISSVVIGEWMVEPGGWIDRDETMVVLETDKINVEVPAPIAGKVEDVRKKTGESASIGEVIATMVEADRPADDGKARTAAAPARREAPPEPKENPRVGPAARRLMEQESVPTEEVRPSGPGGRILKEDVQAVLDARATRAAPSAGPREEQVLPMSPVRQRIAERLVQAQQNAALLTTFNEVDMAAVMQLRQEYGEAFQQRHHVKLGLMSFFVKAAIEALKAFPALNAEIRGQEIVYRNYYDIGVAVGGGKGLVVPVIRNAERLGFAQIELAIRDFAQRATAMKLTLEELQGGTFTISNGGVYGSLLSTPIINPPQSGILGLHKISDRPVALQGQVVIRPVMYVALTYDHRLVDGREAVSFLVRLKDCIENPARMLLEV
ncbi:MAG: 2-oxoglutarate dehydrogenase complex dihydrolipoyllysine-residue succinyltransferase [Armatimonadetes bacterium]|nr:2-oxoglutarate dehydrogenase complex dihydrolipoyllysine-residue succinyltransferase [Armatimonadota bacterium]